MAKAGDQHSSAWNWARLPALPLLPEHERVFDAETVPLDEMFWHGAYCGCPDCTWPEKGELVRLRLDLQLPAIRATRPAPPRPRP